MGAQLPGPPPRRDRSARVTMPKATRGRLERAVARSAAAPSIESDVKHILPPFTRRGLSSSVPRTGRGTPSAPSTLSSLSTRERASDSGPVGLASASVPSRVGRTSLPSGPLAAIASFGSWRAHTLVVGPRRVHPGTSAAVDADPRTVSPTRPASVASALEIEEGAHSGRTRASIHLRSVALLSLPHGQHDRRDPARDRELGQVRLRPVREQPLVVLPQWLPRRVLDHRRGRALEDPLQPTVVLRTRTKRPSRTIQSFDDRVTTPRPM